MGMAVYICGIAQYSCSRILNHGKRGGQCRTEVNYHDGKFKMGYQRWKIKILDLDVDKWLIGAIAQHIGPTCKPKGSCSKGITKETYMLSTSMKSVFTSKAVSWYRPLGTGSFTSIRW